MTSDPSYKKVPYGLRPAKNVQRKMLAEAFGRLRAFHPLHKYRYIGFGSPFFNDFVLFHKALGVTNMICIERMASDAKRFELNKPYGCVDLQFGESTDLLPELEWNTPTICWLDYDTGLDQRKVADIEYVVASAKSGSAIVVTCDARPHRAKDSGGRIHEERLRALREAIDDRLIPSGLKGADLKDWGTAVAFRRIMASAIREKLSERNGALPVDEQVEFEQLFNFQYADSSKMMTFGGVLVSKKDVNRVGDFVAFLDGLDFVRIGDDAFLLEPPNLTAREIRHLNMGLPAGKVDAIRWLSDDEKETYRSIYRYFPVFAESEL